MSSTTTTNMSLIKPGVSSEPGPDWASELNGNADTIDVHDHSTGKGVKIPSSGLNINGNLEMNSNNLIETRSVRFESQSSTFTSSTDNLTSYVSSGELYYRDSAGNNVKITNAGAVNVSGSNGIGGDYGGGNPASLTFTEATSTYTFLENTSGPSYALVDFQGMTNRGAIIQTSTAVSSSPYVVTSTDTVLLVDTSSSRSITLPNAATAKRLLIIKDSTGSSATNVITLDRAAGGNIDGVASNKTLAKAYGQWMLLSDGTNWWVIKEDAKDLTSLTVFEGSRTAGSESATPNAWTSFTLSAAALTEGLAVTRSTNDLTFPATGVYKCKVETAAIAGSSNFNNFGIRIRNTTDSTTADVSTKNPTANESSRQTHELIFNVSNTAKVYQVQYYGDVSGGGVTLTFSNAVFQGETPPRWKITFEKVKDF